MVGRNGRRVPCLYAGVSESRQESVALSAERCRKRGAVWTVDGGVVSGICVWRKWFREGEWVRPVKAYKGARRSW
jgi:hypothetical protein